MAEDRRKQRPEEARFRKIVVHDGLEDAREGQPSPQPPDLNLPDRSQDVRDLIVRISKVCGLFARMPCFRVPYFSSYAS